MQPHVSRFIIPPPRHIIGFILALLLAMGAAACTDDALLTPGAARLDGLAGAPITVTPDSAVVGDTGVVLTIRGSGFTATSVVSVQPWLPVTTSFVDDSTLTARVDWPLEWAAEYQVWVVSETWEEQSAPASFTVTNPVPVITRITPDWCELNSDCVVTLEGRNFMYGMRVLWGGSDVNAQWHSDTRVTYTLHYTQLQWADVVQVTALNPEPTAGASEPALFQVGTRYVLHTAGATAGGGGFELEIYGDGFRSGDVAYWNGSPRETHVFNARRMSIWLTAADVAAPGEGVVTLGTWQVNMGQPFRIGTVAVRAVPQATVTSQLTLSLPVRDLVYSPATERLYGTVYDGPDSGSVAVIDPATGAVESHVYVGPGPRYLALSDDGRHLWVGVDGYNQVTRINLQYASPDMQVQLDSGLVAEDLAAVPGKPHRVAVSRRNTCCSPRHAGVAVYEGWGYGPLPSATPGHIGSNVIEFGLRGSTLYGLDNESTDNRWRTMRVDDGGVEVTSTHWDVGSGFYSDFVFAGGRLYTTAGRVLDTGYNDWAGFFQNLNGAVRPDVQTGRAFFLGDDATIRVADINTFAPLGTISVPPAQFEHPANQRRHLVRWGADGLAWHDADQVFILRTPIAGP